MRRIVQFLCGFSVFVAFFFSWLWTLTFINRVSIYRDREKYRPESYLVTGAEYDHGGELGDSWWLKGTIASQEERFVPYLRGAPSPRSTEDLLTRYPKGTEIDVLYNPDATPSIVQGESLRVLPAATDFWENEARLRHRLGLRVLVPGPLALAIYLMVRFVNRRYARAHPQANAT